LAYVACGLNGGIHSEVTHEDCVGLMESKAVVLAAHHIEEVFGYVVEGWLEYEDEIAKWRVRGQLETLDQSLVRGHFFDARASIERRLVNLLSAARMYSEHVKAKVAAFHVADKEVEDELKGLRNAARQNAPEFIVVDELRNSLQHVALAINGISFGWTRLEKQDRYAGSETTICVQLPKTKPIQDALQQRIDREIQKEQSQVKSGCPNSRYVARLQAELEAVRSIREPLDLQHAARRFCAHVAGMHKSVRDRTSGSVKSAIRHVRDFCDKHGEEHCGERGALVRDENEVGSAGSGEWVGTAIIDRLDVLRCRYAKWESILNQAR
jgi:hypothetical protein